MNIELYHGDYVELSDLFKMSMGIEADEGVRRLLAVEQARGTLYYVARDDGAIVGLIGVYFDPSHTADELEPPQIIDVAVLPASRRQGVARELMDVAVGAVRAAGYNRLWLYTDGHSPMHLAFYRRLGFRLVSVVPDWFGDGSAKVIFRRDL